MSSRRIESLVVAALLSAAAAGCESTPSLAGEWVRSKQMDDDETESWRLIVEENDAGEIDSCAFRYKEVEEDEDDGVVYEDIDSRKGKCEVVEESDGGFEIEIRITSRTVDSGEGEGPQDRLDDLSEGSRKFSWDCTLLEEEGLLECWEDGGDFLRLTKDE